MSEFIAAIELGSYKMTGIAGRKNSDESLQILAYATENAFMSVRKGTVYNINKTAQGLTSLINRLEGQLQCSIAKVYVGVTGQSLHSVKNILRRDLKDGTIVLEHLVHEINDENYGTKYTDADILDIVPQEYKVGNSFQVDPVGVACNGLEGHFLNIIARSSVKKNLEHAFESAKIDMADMFVTPLVTASVTLSESEKRSGCVFIDFGSDTTTISIYKNNLLRFLTLLPLGSHNITHDIVSLQVEEEEAEYLKLAYGNAILEEYEDEKKSVYAPDNKTHAVKLGDLNNVIEARVEEIIANVWHQIQSSSYDDKLTAGIVMTGGGANLKNMDEALRRKTGWFKVRHAQFICNEVYDTKNVLPKDGTCNALLGLLAAGTENCCRLEEGFPNKNNQSITPATDLFEHDESLKKETEKPKNHHKEEEKKKTLKKTEKPKKGWLSGIKDLSDIFSDEEME
ncbi:Cell division protein FtsA [termite gut metagenome]|uniref:Cell division protein FtsA n=1 Tax=termite gut metagenome TaxID=433724 RepID=A0A5J4SFB4_9ZZZZ